ncbi:hypothetical protein SAMN05216416_0021 [Streptococcus equinus]|nr:hypothetical protein SAMN05216416_0021 [Streptococcus equinus]
MEFYKEYSSSRTYLTDGRCIHRYAFEDLNEDIENNPLWTSKVVGYTSNNGLSTILVRWIGLNVTPFKEVEK